MTNCPIRAFDGCNCAPGECHSLAVRLEEHRQRGDAVVRDYLSASAWTARILVVCLCAGVVGLALAVAENWTRNDDRRYQEITGQYARVMLALEKHK